MTEDQKTAVQKTRALEAYLVAASRTGDSGAAERLVHLVQPRLVSHAHRLLGDADAALDITQAAWIDILGGLPRLREVAAFRVYALQIVSRKVARIIKSRQRDRRLADEWAAEAETSVAPLGEIASDAQAVRKAIAKLTPVHQATLALFYLEDMTVTEVAAAMDVPIGTVKTRLMHARKQLRKFLEGEDND